MSEADRKHYRETKADPERYAEYLAQKRAQARARRERGYRRPNKAIVKARWRAKYPEAAKRLRDANHAVELAVIAGKLVKPTSCARCGKIGPVQGHHWSYEKEHWLDVEWLCQGCHVEEHRK